MKKKKNDENIISNYIKVILIFLAVIVLVLFLRSLYLNNKQLNLNTPVLDEVVTHQIKSNELYNFINDNDTSLIYMCVANDENCRNLEKDIKKLISKYSLEDVIVYLNLSDNTNIFEFYNDLIDRYSYDKELKEYPTFLFFENGKISKSLSGKDINKDDVNKFLKEINFIHE